ncbi:ty3-gypsy retrotransposon protein [Tanacetum coccineum]
MVGSQTDGVYGVYELYNLASDKEGQASTPAATATTEHPKIAQLLAWFDLLFQVATTLPPHHYASVAAPLSNLLQKNGFKWGEPKSKAFDDLKNKLTHAPILGLSDFDDTFVIETDASVIGIGDVLLQKGSPSVTLAVTDALSRMFEEDEGETTAFMSLSQPLVGLIDELKKENETLEELRHIHQKLDPYELLVGFRREHGMLIFHDRYYVREESKLKGLLLSEFHENPIAGYGGAKKMCLLQPLPTLSAMWEDVSMDYITGLPVSKGLTVILTDGQIEVVNRRLEQYLKDMVSYRPHLENIHYPPKPLSPMGCPSLWYIFQEQTSHFSSSQSNFLPRPNRTEKTTRRVQSHPEDSKILEAIPLKVCKYHAFYGILNTLFS